MNFELIAAVIALLRTVGGIATPLAVGSAAARIYPASQVPVDALFPRCYVGLRRTTAYGRWPQPLGSRDRHVTLNVYFASTLAISATAYRDIEGWDALANAALDYAALGVADLVYLRRSGDEPIRQQQDDRNTYLMGGGIYDAYFQRG